MYVNPMISPYQATNNMERYTISRNTTLFQGTLTALISFVALKSHRSKSGSDRIINEEDRVPTLTSLWQHWLRSRPAE